MNNQELIEMLKRADACSNALEWVGQRDLKTAWTECQRADWMAWGLAQMAGKPGWPTHMELVSIAVYCARRAYRFVDKDPDNVIINCIKAVEAWVKNPCEETKQKVQRSRAAAYAVYAFDAVAIRAAVYTAARAAADAAAYAAADAAVYVADAVGYVIYADADAEAEHKAVCDHIRQTVNIPV